MNKIVRIEKGPDSCDLAGKVIGLAMRVHSKLGPGFLESVYRNALAGELRRAGLKVEAEKPISVFYEGDAVGAFVADLLVNDALIVEAKAIQALAKVQEVQLVSLKRNSVCQKQSRLRFEFFTGKHSVQFVHSV